MATYAIGDSQGCLQELRALLEKIDFEPARDQLWLTGDLVNRGPDSLGVLRFIRALGERAIVVQGNHDLHLLAVAHGHTDRLHKRDTLDAVLAAPDRDELLEWLRRRPMLHHDAELGFLMVHAGLPPQWDLRLALNCARELESVLHGHRYREFLDHMYGNSPPRWEPELSGWPRMRFITNCLTRMRYCDTDGALNLKAKGPPGTQPPGCVPWFEAPGRRTQGLAVIFGHWSTLRPDPQGASRTDIYPLDTGCVWGGTLTALRLDDRRLYSVAATSRPAQDVPDKKNAPRERG